MSQERTKARIIELTRLIRDERARPRDRRNYSDDQIRAFRRELSTLQSSMKAAEAKTNPVENIVKAKAEAEVFRHFTVGFELETHATQSVTSATINSLRTKYNQERKVDEKKWKQYILNQAKEMMKRSDSLRRMPTVADKEIAKFLFIQKFVRNSGLPAAQRNLAKELLDSGEWEQFAAPLDVTRRDQIIANNNISVNSLAREKLLSKERLSEIEKALQGAVIKSGPPDQVKTGKNYTSVDFLETMIPDFDSKLMQIGTDGTVRGFEIRTLGGLSIREFMKCTNILFGPKVTHAVDTGCSFHLHVGLKGADISYSPKFQSALIEYLLEHIAEVPDGVRQRWRTIPEDGPHGRFFRPQLSRDKYSFVNYHERCNTWEFRCFGNLNTKEDAIKCLYLAMRAMIFAYKVTHGLIKPVLGEQFSKYGREVLKSISTTQPISKVVNGG